jgi:hypothetical protein
MVDFVEDLERMTKCSRKKGGRQAYGTLLRCALLGLAALAGLWSVTAGLGALKVTALTAVAERILGGEEYKQEALTRILTAADVANRSGCRPANEGEAITTIAYGIARAAITSDDQSKSAERLRAVENEAMAALACSPHRGALWFFLFWAKTHQTGFQSTNLPLLWMSYRLAPHEGWLQVHRNPFIIQFIDALPLEGKQFVLVEFGELIEAGFAQTAAETFADVSDPVRESLFPIVERVSEPKRQQFGNALETLGLDVEISGVSNRRRENWERYITAVDKVRDVLKEVSKAPERTSP